MKNLEGFDQVMANLNKEIGAIEDRSIGGLLAAGLKVQGESQGNVPVEYGNLRAGAYTQKAPDDPSAVEIGYQAAYAPFVHENMEMKLKGRPRPSGLGVYWGPSGGPKFLERAVTDLQEEIVSTVANHASVK